MGWVAMNKKLGIVHSSQLASDSRMLLMRHTVCTAFKSGSLPTQRLLSSVTRTYQHVNFESEISKAIGYSIYLMLGILCFVVLLTLLAPDLLINAYILLRKLGSFLKAPKIKPF